MNALTSAEVIVIQDMIADLEHISEKCQSGVRDHDLRHMTAQLREIADGQLARVWRLAGFSKQPMIRAAFLDTVKLTKFTFGIVAGAIDHNPAKSYSDIHNPTQEQINQEILSHTHMFMPAVVGVKSDGSTVLMPSSGSFSHFITTTDDADIDDLITRDLPISEFFRSTAIFYYGKKIKRHDIVRFVAVARNGVHPRHNKRTPKDIEIDNILEEFSKEKLENRDAILYLHQSIAQDIVNSDDVKKLISWRHE